MSTLHSTEVHHYWKMAIRSQSTAIMSSIIGLLCIGSIPLVPTDYQIVPATAAVLSGIAGQTDSKAHRDNRRILDTGERIGNDQYRNRLFKIMDTPMLAALEEAEPVSNLTPLVSGTYKPRMYDWENIKPRGENFKHIAVLGATGDGKTTLVEFLFKLLGGYQLVITPHHKPGDYPGIKVIGKARNYGAMEDATARPLHKLLDPKYDKFSIADAALSLMNEMDVRYLQYQYKGSDGLPFINVAWDEYRTQVANVPTYHPTMTKEEKEAGIKYPPVKGVGDTVKDLLQEARKVLMRMILLLHDQGVKTGGFEGEGGLRNSFIWVRLGQFALDHAWKLVKDEKLTEQDYEWLAEQKYPTMVGDMMAEIYPEYFDNRAGQGINAKQEDMGDGTVVYENQYEYFEAHKDISLKVEDDVAPAGAILGEAVETDSPSVTAPIAPVDPKPGELEDMAPYEPIATLFPSKVQRRGYWMLLNSQAKAVKTEAELLKSMGITAGSGWTKMKSTISELTNEFGALEYAV